MSTPPEKYDSRTADKFVVRLPPGMRERVRIRAAGEFRSMNDFAIDAIDKALGRGDAMDLLLANAAKHLAFSEPAKMVMDERQRQINAEGWTLEHDDAHACDEIAALACYYAMPPIARLWSAESTGFGDMWGDAILPLGWVGKPTWNTAFIDAGPNYGRLLELAKAGALVLAEMERLMRADKRAAEAAEAGEK